MFSALFYSLNFYFPKTATSFLFTGQLNICQIRIFWLDYDIPLPKNLTLVNLWKSCLHHLTFILFFSTFTDTAVNYLGCFSSPSDMVLSNDTVVSKLTPERCVTACGKAGKRYAGITQGTQCHCSNNSPDVDKVTDDAACYYPCEGDKALKCGSNLYFSVYYAPGQYDFPLALSVTSASEAFERVKITVTPNYGSLVMLNFGDGTVIYTKNSSIEYVFTTLGLHEVLFCISAGFIESGTQDVFY